MSLAVFAFSVTLALILTNLDNLAVMVALMLRLPKKRVLIAFVTAQVIVLAVAKAIAEGIEIGLSAQAGWLGIVPILIGVRALLQENGGEGPKARDDATLVALVLLFLSISSDSLIVLAPLLADAAPGHRVAGIFGAILAWGGLMAAGLKTAQAGGTTGWARRLERLAPWVMIAVGTYVLLDTATDMT
ncbi:hypothetical protein [Shimia aestuarii]|uniref:Cadmium resistance transporter (Or sequestration) family protein n=1 Tax=Shimia aestuarii TaxID=254406 RepID=A0A1I4NFM2_9RHOB|nr:hypothetical protein [Shimia aestuarii]SFM14301.1 hypothetical protein SAMN04488042_104165 [Shimia aestuarii]